MVCHEDGTIVSDLQIDEVLDFDHSHSFGLLRLFNSAGSDDFDGNECIRFLVKTSDGVLEALDPIRYTYTIGTKSILRLLATSFRFRVIDGNAMYWRMPVTNFICNYILVDPELDAHPLRRNDERDMSAVDNSHLGQGLVVFERNGAKEFIEPASDYVECRRRLARGDLPVAITAAIIGNVGECSVSLEELRRWLPYDLLLLLSVASGYQVASPWVELWDQSGRLLERIHWRTAPASALRPGHVAIDEWLHRGTGYLLTCALRSSHWNTSHLRVCVANYIRGSSTWVMDDRVGHFARALDGLCAFFGVAEQNLLARLGPQMQDDVKKIVSVAADRVRKLGQNNATGDRDVLGRIANRMTDTPRKDKNFGLAVVDLLDLMGLPDAAIMHAFYDANPRADGSGWAGLLSKYRGAALHGVPFASSESERFMDDLFMIGQHLQDIILRVLFKMFDYDHVYQPPVIKGISITCVDWVTQSHSASDLGYS